MTKVHTTEELEKAVKAKEIDIYLEGDVRKEVLRTNAQAMFAYIIGAIMVIVSGIVLIFLPSDNRLMTTIVKAILYCGGAALLVGLWMKYFKGYDAECLSDGQLIVKNI